jgi:hypothetical protein
LQQMNCKWHTRKESPAQNPLQAIDDNSKSIQISLYKGLWKHRSCVGLACRYR